MLQQLGVLNRRGQYRVRRRFGLGLGGRFGLGLRRRCELGAGRRFGQGARCRLGLGTGRQGRQVDAPVTRPDAQSVVVACLYAVHIGALRRHGVVDVAGVGAGGVVLDDVELPARIHGRVSAQNLIAGDRRVARIRPRQGHLERSVHHRRNRARARRHCRNRTATGRNRRHAGREHRKHSRRSGQPPRPCRSRPPGPPPTGGPGNPHIHPQQTANRHRNPPDSRCSHGHFGSCFAAAYT